MSKDNCHVNRIRDRETGHIIRSSVFKRVSTLRRRFQAPAQQPSIKAQNSVDQPIEHPMERRVSGGGQPDRRAQGSRAHWTAKKIGMEMFKFFAREIGYLIFLLGCKPNWMEWTDLDDGRVLPSAMEAKSISHYPPKLQWSGSAVCQVCSTSKCVKYFTRKTTKTSVSYLPNAIHPLCLEKLNKSKTDLQSPSHYCCECGRMHKPWKGTRHKRSNPIHPWQIWAIPQWSQKNSKQ